ncbi:MAG: hypothetical protein ACM3OA_15380 [Acidobacteriota bacterium]
MAASLLEIAIAVPALVVSFWQHRVSVSASHAFIPGLNGNFPVLLGVLMTPHVTIS